MADRVARKLAAILSADVVGYSRLMAEDEAETVRMVTAYRELVSMLVRQHAGRVVDSPGDNLLAEFPTATDAVETGAEIQRVIHARNRTVPAARRMEYRIGIHLGEVRVEGERIYGDGVNIASRLEGLAEPGGVCISRNVHEQVGGRTGFEFDDLGEQAFKNIPRPVHAYRMKTRGETGREGSPRIGRRAAFLIVAAILTGAVITAWQLWSPERQPGFPETAGQIRSLAVLPLANLSGDPTQDYFADGMTEALIADLARIRSLRVISRTSIMRYKGARRPLPEIARELDVDGVVEGSVLRNGNRVRVVAQLIHAATDQHLWSQIYERDLDDVITLQRAVADAIVREIRIQLTAEEKRRLEAEKTVRPAAYDAYLQGRYFWNKRTAEDLERAIARFREAIEIDPDFALGYAGLAAVYDTQGVVGLITPRQAASRIEGSVMRALELDDSLAEAHTALGDLHWWNWNWDGVEREYRRAIELNPGYATVHGWYGYFLISSGRIEEGLAEFDLARQLDPLAASILTDGCMGYLYADRHERALDHCMDALRIDPGYAYAYATLSAVYTDQERYDDAVAAGRRAVELSGGGDLQTSCLAHAYARSGDRERASELLDELIRRSRDRYVDATFVAAVHAALGNDDQMFEWLEKAYEERAFELNWLSVTPAYRRFRTDPRFKDLVRRIGRGVGGPSDPTAGDRPSIDPRRIRSALDGAFDLCEHWGGEEAYDDARARDIREGSKRDCEEAIRVAKEAMIRMPEDPVVAAIVIDLANYIGDPEAREIVENPHVGDRLCSLAAAYYRDFSEARSRFRGYFEAQCPARASELPPAE